MIDRLLRGVCVAALAASAHYAAAQAAPSTSSAPAAARPAASASSAQLRGPQGAYVDPAGDKVDWQNAPTMTVERDVAFDLGSAVIKPAARQQILTMASAMKPTTEIQIIGRDDPSLKEGLAESRASAIQAVLQEAGISPDAIRVRIAQEHRAVRAQAQAKRGRPAATDKATDSEWASTIRWRAYRSARVQMIEPSVAAARGRPSAATAVASAAASVSPPVAARAATASALVPAPVAPPAPAAVVVAPMRVGVEPVVGASTPAPATRAGAGVAAQAAGADEWRVLTSDVVISKVIGRWARVAGVTLVWDSSRDYQIVAADTIRGSFENAVESLLSSPSILRGDHPLEACLYEANEPKLLRITRMGDQSDQCVMR